MGKDKDQQSYEVLSRFRVRENGHDVHYYEVKFEDGIAPAAYSLEGPILDLGFRSLYWGLTVLGLVVRSQVGFKRV